MCDMAHISGLVAAKVHFYCSGKISFNLVVSLIVSCITMCTIVNLFVFYAGADCLEVGVNTSDKEL
jgi:hypothetical protein